MQEPNNRAFKGVWIPKAIWLARDLGWTEKMVLVELDSLNGEQGCFASNEYLASFFGLSKGRISKVISSLREKGYITVDIQYKKGTKEIERRIVKTTIGVWSETATPPSQEQPEALVESVDTPMVENSQDNNTVINNTFNNTSYINNDDEKAVPARPTQASLENAFTFYQANGFGALGSHIGEKVGAWIDDVGEELVIHAMKLAVENSATRWNYVESILLGWSQKQIKSVEQAEAEKLRFAAEKSKQQAQRRPGNYGRKVEIVPEWMHKEQKPSAASAALEIPSDADIDVEYQKLLAQLRNSRQE